MLLVILLQAYARVQSIYYGFGDVPAACLGLEYLLRCMSIESGPMLRANSALHTARPWTFAISKMFFCCCQISPRLNCCASLMLSPRPLKHGHLGLCHPPLAAVLHTFFSAVKYHWCLFVPCVPQDKVMLAFDIPPLAAVLSELHYGEAADYLLVRSGGRRGLMLGYIYKKNCCFCHNSHAGRMKTLQVQKRIAIAMGPPIWMENVYYTSLHHDNKRLICRRWNPGCTINQLWLNLIP